MEPAVVGIMSQLKFTDAWPTIANKALTVFAGPADVVEEVPVPAGVIALTLYINDAPGVIAVVASTHTSMAEQLYPGVAFSA